MSSSDRHGARPPSGRLRILRDGASRAAVRPVADGLQVLHAAAVGVHAPAQEPARPGDAELLRQEFQRGLGEGRAQMAKELEADMEEQREAGRRRMDELLARIAAQVPPLVAGRERLVVQLAFAIAERIVKQAVEADRDVVLRQVREAVRRVHGLERIIVRVHPDDADLVRARRLDLAAGSEAARELTVEPDEQVGRGGCMLESDSGTVDARLMTQMQNLETALLEHRETGERT